MLCCMCHIARFLCGYARLHPTKEAHIPLYNKNLHDWHTFWKLFFREIPAELPQDMIPLVR